MNKKYIIFLLFFIIPFATAQAIQRITITDLTGDFEDRLTIYQNDNYSNRYVQSTNISDVEPIKISAGHDFNLVMTPKTISMFREITGPDFFNSIYRFIWPVLMFFAFLILAVIIWKRK